MGWERWEAGERCQASDGRRAMAGERYSASERWVSGDGRRVSERWEAIE